MPSQIAQGTFSSSDTGVPFTAEPRVDHIRDHRMSELQLYDNMPVLP